MLEAIAERQCAFVQPEPEVMPMVCLEVPIEKREQEDRRSEAAGSVGRGSWSRSQRCASESNWGEALPLFEEAYRYAPGKHGFALKIAQTAEMVGDCAKAITYYEHFVTYAEPDKYGKDIKKAKKKVAGLHKTCESNE